MLFKDGLEIIETDEIIYYIRDIQFQKTLCNFTVYIFYFVEICARVFYMEKKSIDDIFVLYVKNTQYLEKLYTNIYSILIIILSCLKPLLLSCILWSVKIQKHLK